LFNGQCVTVSYKVVHVISVHLSYMIWSTIG